MEESALKISVIDAFQALSNVLSDFAHAIRDDDHLVAWIQEDDFPLPSRYSKSYPRLRACEVFQQCQYLETQAPREIIICAGFIGASEKTIEIAHQVNEVKNHFKEKMIALKKANLSVKDNWLSQQFTTLLRTRDQHTKQALHSMGLARLHLKQCYRKIPILADTPKKISWTWAHTKSIKRITAKEAYELLMKKSTQPGIQMQMEKLAKIPQNEPLAIVQELAPHLRANIVTPIPNSKDVQRKMIKGPVPILFPADARTPFPEFKPPHKKQQRNENREIRSDVKIDPEPFLPTIRAHRYQAEPVCG